MASSPLYPPLPALHGQPVARVWILPQKRWLQWTVWVGVPLLMALIWTIGMASIPRLAPVLQREAISGAFPRGLPSRQSGLQLLEQVRVVDTRPQVMGYERGCGGNQACSFGPAWSDNTDAPLGHNGVDTRSDMFRVHEPSYDPYTGQFVTAARAARHIDHIFPLAAAWDLGAALWSPATRARFANDTDRNLVIVGAAINEEKGDLTPESWMPPWRAGHCWYASRYVTVAAYYDLAITRADARVLRKAIKLCPR